MINKNFSHHIPKIQASPFYQSAFLQCQAQKYLFFFLRAVSGYFQSLNQEHKLLPAHGAPGSLDRAAQSTLDPKALTAKMLFNKISYRRYDSS